jgi:hypothetical protein
MRTTVRLTIKQHRFGIVGFGLILLAFSAGAAALAAYFASLGLAACENDTSSACMAISQQISAVNMPYSLLRAASLPVAVLAGVFLGVPIVAGEIERGTAVLPWTLGRSRIRWFLARLIIIGAILTLLTTLLGLALDAMQQSLNPWAPITSNLADYEGRGWLVPARALVGFAAGVLTGSVLGRSLPGLLAGLVIGVVLVVGVIPLADGWNRANRIDVTGDRGGLDLGLALRDRSSGEIVSYQEGEAIMSPDDPAFPERFEEVRIGIPGSDSSLVIGREVTTHALEVIALLGASVTVVNRRRPY